MNVRTWCLVGRLLAGGLLAVITPPGSSAEPNGPERLERAIYLEETVGDLERAGEAYRNLLAGEREPVRSQARQRLAGVLAKQGRNAEASQLLAQNDPQPKAAATEKKEQSLAAPLQEAAELIEKAYVFPLDRKQFAEKAIQDLLGSLEGSSEYLNENTFQELSRSFDQQLVGIGVQIQIEGGRVLVAAPLPGSPSEKGGIAPGDEILAIGGTPLADVAEEERLQKAVNSIRGKAGEPVELRIRRGDDTRTFTIVRAALQLESVRGDTRTQEGGWQFLLDPEKKIGYLRILQFGGRTSGEVRAALEKLQELGAKAVVLDLRGCPGGLLAEAANICDLFLESGKIVSVRTRGGEEQVIEAKAEGTFKDLPVAVLANRHTASAAEIVASCLQDHQRAVIVGEKTFGQGLVYSMLPVKSTGGALRLATGIYVRPSGKTVYHPKANAERDAAQEDGRVTPNEGLEVSMSDEELNHYKQYRHARDLLPADGAAQAPFEDRQLAKALEYLREKIGT